MKRVIRGDVLEEMCKRYWDAYRDGHIAVGGDPSYPTWDQFAEAKAKDETRRCMRHAVEALLDLPDTAFTADAKQKAHVRMERGAFKALHERVFPEKPMRRKGYEKMQSEAIAEALNKGLQ